jgi:fission process protein 1
MTNHPNSEKEETNNKPYDIFRDSPLRYLGYANEVGESFRYQFPRFVVPSYAVAFGYCLADAGTTGYNTWKAGLKDSSRSTTTEITSLVAIDTVDTLLWQSLASVAIPGATINMIVRACRVAVSRSPMMAFPVMVTWLPTAVGLGSVPFIIHPIDRGVDWLMDSTFRQWLV